MKAGILLGFEARRLRAYAGKLASQRIAYSKGGATVA
jgi:hypothetical protein